MCSHSADKKKALRREMLRLRNDIRPENRERWNRQLAKRFLELPEVKNSDMVYCYISYGTEIDTRSIVEMLRIQGKRVALPRVTGRDMVFYEISGMEDTVPGYKKIPEPAQHCKAVSDPKALILMPGLAFTREGNRMGYGGGFYDRFLAKEPEHGTVALAYPFQLLEEIPTEIFDHRIEVVLLPDCMIRCGYETDCRVKI